MRKEAGKAHRLQILLREECRSDAERNAVVEALRKLGVDTTGEGSATIAARVSAEDLQRLFPPDSNVKGALRVPGELEKFVSSITEAPDHLYF